MAEFVSRIDDAAVWPLPLEFLKSLLRVAGTAPSESSYQRNKKQNHHKAGMRAA